jgi:hypothetical protein
MLAVKNEVPTVAPAQCQLAEHIEIEVSDQLIDAMLLELTLHSRRDSHLP